MWGCSRRRRLLGLVSITLLTTCWTLLRLEHGGPHAATVEGGRPLSPCLINASHPLCKRILIWNGVDRIETEAFGVGHQAFVEARCPVSDCVLTRDRAEFALEDVDAVVFHGLELRPGAALPAASRRRRHQRYVFLTQESPAALSRLDLTPFADYFNWSMSYRFDADIHLLYGRAHPQPRLADWDVRQIRAAMAASRRPGAANRTASKKRSVAWMASHCPTTSQRERYVEELQRHIDVDVYGQCGNLSCRRDARHWQSDPACYRLLGRRYKFYLSFENALCVDYVSEKFWNILRHDLVPVVYGGADYHLVAPPHSFIDAMRYTPAELARYLRRLDLDDRLYDEFFWWKEHYDIEAGVQQMARHGFCDLCRKLHQADESLTNSSAPVDIYRSLVDDWNAELQCRSHQVASGGGGARSPAWPDLFRFTLNG